MNAHVPRSVGLGGDGDEIDAILDVEKEFGIILDKADAAKWLTAGDVSRSLCNALPDDEKSAPDVWTRFAQALSQQTGINPQSIETGSPLLSQPSLWVVMSNVNAFLYAIIFMVVASWIVWVLL